MWSILVDDESVIHLDDAIAQRCNVGIVGDDEKGGVLFGIQSLEKCENLPRGFGIQIPSWLVAKNHRRTVNDGSGDSDPLLLPTRKLRRTMLTSLSETYVFQCFKRPLAGIIGPIAEEEERKFHIFDGGKDWKEVEVLEYESKILRTH